MNTSALSCADCSAPNPQWASINRGVLICNECCSVHRSLGRHVSQVRSIRAPNWPPVQKEMLFTLYNKGANSLWEHALHNSSSKVKLKKPSYRDKLQTTRHDFIIAKYKNLQLLPRISHKDNPNAYQDLSKQLHASVRTNNLETCLRLLALGGNPNFCHPERGNTPLHVASQAGQAMQVELLIIHGANPCTLDGLGHTPEECARSAITSLKGQTFENLEPMAKVFSLQLMPPISTAL
ncbi:ARF GTPase-activating protein GIT2 [Geodia barretti]|uniref:ARF GTPase-activating protein GIT2 n=1 Tax=Geodia barretti TaxID=519541 RepID=A0AA35RKZ5_GEOBA|nr:ARF GTPase-activating protein GIT2 [Geodia barretti]